LVLIVLNDHAFLRLYIKSFCLGANVKNHVADLKQLNIEWSNCMRSVSVRFFIITNNSEIFSVSINKIDRLLKGTNEEKIERFAGERVRASEIGVRLENRKPIEVIRAIYHYFHFDEKGILDIDRLRNDGTIVSIAGISPMFTQKPQDNIINAQQEFAKRQRDHSVWWKPDMQLERNILDAAIGEFKCKRL
jgi:hypothetical protein